MQEDQTCQSECGVFTMLPEHGDEESPPLLPPMADTKQLERLAEGPISPPFSCVQNSTSSSDSSSEHHQREAFDANIMRAYQIKRKVRAWHDAILRKRELALQILQAQKAIEEVENEAAQYLTRDTITRMHQKCFNLNGDDAATRDGEFISAISRLRVMS